MEARKKYNHCLVVTKQFDATLSVYSNEVEAYVYAWCMVLLNQRTSILFDVKVIYHL
jgi:hypothetical protein